MHFSNKIKLWHWNFMVSWVHFGSYLLGLSQCISGVKVSHQNEYHHDVSDPINVQSQPVSLIFHGHEA